MPRAKYACPWTGKGTSIDGEHESCGNRSHDEDQGCQTCGRGCQAYCQVEGMTRFLDDRPTHFLPAIARASRA